MAGAAGWELMVGLLAVIGPLVGVPLSLIVFYLRSLREQQIAWSNQFTQREEQAELELSRQRDELTRLADEIDHVKRDFTTKEEWLRELMAARGQMEQLRGTTGRLAILLEAWRVRSDVPVGQDADAPDGQHPEVRR